MDGLQFLVAVAMLCFLQDLISDYLKIRYVDNYIKLKQYENLTRTHIERITEEKKK